MYHHIMVPLDGSALAEKALPYATGLTHRLEAKVTLVQVLELPPVLEGSLDTEAALISSAETYLQQIKAVMTGTGLVQPLRPEQVQTKVAFGNPKHEMAVEAAAIKADLVVMTTHGRSGLAQLIMGSNAASLIQHTTIPVLLIRPLPLEVSRSLTDAMAVPLDFDFEKAQGPLLVTLDGTPEAEVVLEPAIKLAQAINIPIHLLRVVPPLVPFSYGDISTRFSQDIRDEVNKYSQEAYQYLDQIQAQVSAQGLECNCSVRVGEAAKEILDFVHTTNPSLLAMATRGRGRLGQVLLGSVAGEVAHHCQLPVLLVHMPVHEAHHAQASSTRMA